MEIKMKLAGEPKSSDSEQMWQRYVRAERLLAANAQELTSDLIIKPNWINGSDSFWYRWKSLADVEFVFVDPATGERKAAFDHDRLAAALSQTTGAPFTAAHLPFSEIEFAEDGLSIAFDIEGNSGRWSCDLKSYVCTRIGDSPVPPNDALRSPDGQREAFARDHNVWVRSVATGEERAITEDGVAKHDYGAPLLSPLTTGGIDDPPPPAISWSPDSSKLLFCRVDQREAPQFHLVQSVPNDGSIRPHLHSYAYPLPGDEIVPLAQLICADLNVGTVGDIDLEPKEVQYHGPPLSADTVWWSNDSETIYFVRQGRGYFRMDLCIIDAKTGASRIAITEESRTGIDPSVWRGQSNIRIFAQGSRVVWYSQRDGWGHLYLYDADSGALHGQLTSGSYDVSNVEYVDEAAGMVYFTAVGREANRDPYYSHLYRVSLDGGEPELLTPEDADHTISFAPGGQCFIDNYSTVDQAPVILLRAADGSTVCELEQADISVLEGTGWQKPERFKAKARDGSTDVYGVIFRPSDLDPEAQYPVIDYIYGGPQAIQAPAAFAGAARQREKNFWEAQSLAELGFAVVMIDGLGMPGPFQGTP